MVPTNTSRNLFASLLLLFFMFPAFAQIELVKDINSQLGAGTSNSANYTDIAGILYFTAEDGENGIELWKSDGTMGGTVMVKDIRTGINSSDPLFLTNVNGTLYFSADDGIHGKELWKSDGTEGGTIRLTDVSTTFVPKQLTDYNGTLYFLNDADLWKSDGTVQGTV